jgi:6-phosphogluconolactonase
MKRALLLLALAACGDDAASPVDASADAQPADTSPADGSQPDATGPDGASPDAAPPLAPLFAFVGSGDGAIRAYSVNESTGALALVATANPGGNPSFLAMIPALRRIYACDESKNQVRAFSFDPKLGQLVDLGSPVASGGGGPTHVGLDPSGKWLFAANYGGATAAVFPIQGSGALGPASDTQSPGAMAHQAIANPSGGFVFVPALGANVIAQYKLDGTTGKLSQNGTASPPANAGPRHLAFRPDEKFAYGINEKASTMTTYAFDATSGKLTANATVTTLPNGFSGQNTCAEVVVHPSGAFVYGSNRGDDSIVTFASDKATGALTLVGHTKTGGKTPRSFALDPAAKLLFAANQGSGTVAAFTIGNDGKPVASGAPQAVPSPTFVGAWRVP